MPSRSLFWLLFPAFAAIGVLSAAVAGWLAHGQLEQAFLQSATEELRLRADFLQTELTSDQSSSQEFARLVSRNTQLGDVRVGLISPTGEVELDSRNRPEEVKAQIDRPEIQQALAGSADSRVRYLAAQEVRVLYLASPIWKNDRLTGVFYLSQPLTALDTAAAGLRTRVLLACAAAVAAAAALARWTASRIESGLTPFHRATEQISAGQSNVRVSPAEAGELVTLAGSFNRMAESLQQRIAVLVQNNNEQKAVLASMAEGVLAVDRQERIISMNRASGRLLGLDPAQVPGRQLQEAVRNADLARFVARALAASEPIEDDVLLLGDRQRVMRAHGSALADVEGRPIGAVIVLNDVTDFRRLEHIRRDFVANVSHELKTPITSIKGFVETLLDGAIHDPHDAERFLRIMGKQADRLHAIIEDLLALSKIEQGEDSEEISLDFGALKGVLDSAVATCLPAAEERNIKITLSCPAELKAKINPVLLEQAVVNLLDNAIKYSEPGREVDVAAQSSGSEVTLRVTDHGCGIASEHLSRVFERFYRVDPARSRKLGGTGLGLAIVKHIVQAHRGRIDVTSELGKGSTFTIYLPT